MRGQNARGGAGGRSCGVVMRGGVGWRASRDVRLRVRAYACVQSVRRRCVYMYAASNLWPPAPGPRPRPKFEKRDREKTETRDRETRHQPTQPNRPNPNNLADVRKKGPWVRKGLCFFWLGSTHNLGMESWRALMLESTVLPGAKKTEDETRDFGTVWAWASENAD